MYWVHLPSFHAEPRMEGRLTNSDGHLPPAYSQEDKACHGNDKSANNQSHVSREPVPRNAGVPEGPRVTTIWQWQAAGWSEPGVTARLRQRLVTAVDLSAATQGPRAEDPAVSSVQSAERRGGGRRGRDPRGSEGRRTASSPSTKCPVTLNAQERSLKDTVRLLHE